MRFFLFDRVTRLDPGAHIEGVATFALSEDYLANHFGRAPVLPGVILVEAMVQLLGWCIIHAHGFRCVTLLTLLEGVSVPTHLPPPCVARVAADVVATSASDSLGRAWVEVDGERVASVERVIYTHVGAEDPAALAALFAASTGLPAPETAP